MKKVTSKDKRVQIFDALYSIMHTSAAPGASIEEVNAVVRDKLNDFYSTFEDEPEFMAYVRKEWDPKLGMALLSMDAYTHQSLLWRCLF